MARTITPNTGAPTYNNYKVLIWVDGNKDGSMDNGETAAYQNDSVSLGDAHDPVDVSGLSAGTQYRVQIIGQVEYNGSLIDAAKGVTTFTATSDSGAATVELKPIPMSDWSGSGDGFFAYDITAPANYNGIVSLKGPRAAGTAPGSVTTENIPGSGGTNYQFINGSTSAAAHQAMTKQELAAGIYDFSLSFYKIGADADTAVASVSETVYIYPGLTTTAQYNYKGLTPSGKGALVFLAGTLSINNAGNYDLGTISINAYTTGAVSGLGTATLTTSSGLTALGTCNTSAPIKDSDNNLIGTAKITSANASASTVTVQWGMAVSESDLSSTGSQIVFKAFSSNTTAGGAQAPLSIPLFLASDRVDGTDMTTTGSQGYAVTNVSSLKSGIALADRAVGPPKLLRASIYTGSPSTMELVFNSAVALGGSDSTYTYSGINPWTLAITPNQSITVNKADVKAGSGGYIWDMTLSGGVNVNASVTLDYDGSGKNVVDSLYSIPMQSFTAFTVKNDVSSDSVAPTIIARYIAPCTSSVDEANSIADPRAGDTLTLVFDKQVIFPAVNADKADLGFSLSATPASGAPAKYKKSVTADTTGNANSGTRTAPSDFAAALPWTGDSISDKANGSRAASIWVLPLAATAANSKFSNNFAIQGDDYTISYTPVSNNGIKGNGASPASLVAFGSTNVDNRITANDWTPPAVASAYVAASAASKLVVNFSEPVTISGGTASNALGFGLTVNGSNASFATDAVTGSGSQYNLTFSPAIIYGQAVSLSSSSGSTLITDDAGNYYAAQTGNNSVSVDNRVTAAPTLTSAMIMDTSTHTNNVITLSFDQPVSFPSNDTSGFALTGLSRTTAAAAHFGALNAATVISSAAPLPANQAYSTTWALTVNVNGNTNDTFVYGDTVDITYTPSSDTTNKKVNVNNQQLQAVTAPTAPAYNVTNYLAATDTTPPTIISASATVGTGNNHAYLTLAFSEPVYMPTTSTAVFNVYGTSISPSDLTGSGKQFTLIYNPAPTWTASSPATTCTMELTAVSSFTSMMQNIQSKALKLAYTGTGDTVIKDAAGNAMVNFTYQQIDNFLAGDYAPPTIVSSTVTKDAGGHAQVTFVFDKPVTIIANSVIATAGIPYGWAFQMNSTTMRLVPTSPSGWGTAASSAKSNIWVFSIRTTASPGAATVLPLTSDKFYYTYTSPANTAENTQDKTGNALASTTGPVLCDNGFTAGDAGVVTTNTYHPGNTVYLTQGHYPYTTVDSYVQDGLVFQLDGIANKDSQDSDHQDSSSGWTQWTNLKDSSSAGTPATVTSTSTATGINGGEQTQASMTQSWWQATMGFSSVNGWTWDSSANLPVLAQ